MILGGFDRDQAKGLKGRIRPGVLIAIAVLSLAATLAKTVPLVTTDYLCGVGDEIANFEHIVGENAADWPELLCLAPTDIALDVKA